MKLKRSKGEALIEKYLIKNNFTYDFQYSFKDCKFINILKFDFVVFDDDGSILFLIEYDGKQHFYPIRHFGGHDALIRNQHRDDAKTEYCKNNKIKLIRIPYTQHNQIEEVLDDYFLNDRAIDYESIMRYWSNTADEKKEKEEKALYGFVLDDSYYLELDDVIYEYICEQLFQLEDQGLYEVYMYLINLYNLPIANNEGWLFYEILENDFRETGVHY